MNRTSQIIRKATRRKNMRPAWTKEQEDRYRSLLADLENLGFVVRREELKRGHCWKVVSGSCRSLGQNFIFVDSRLPPQEQVGFLEAKLVEMHALVDGGSAVSQAA